MVDPMTIQTARRLLIGVALALPLLGVAAFLVLGFQLFVGSAGGCGGG